MEYLVNRILKEGDIVSLDVGAYYKGYHSDSAKTHGVGIISEEDRKLIEVAKESFYEGIKFAKLGYRLSDISHAIQAHVEKHGFSVVRDLVGHGVGVIFTKILKYLTMAQLEKDQNFKKVWS